MEASLSDLEKQSFEGQSRYEYCWDSQSI